MHESLLTTNDLAEYLGLEPGAIRTRLCRGQDLPPYLKLGREYRWRPVDVEAWIEDRLEYPKTQSPDPPRERVSRGGRPRNSSFPGE